MNGYRITAFRVNHNVICYGYTKEILRQGKFSPERAKEQAIPLKYWNPLQKGQTIEVDGVVYTPNMVLGPDRKGIKVTYKQIPGLRNQFYEMLQNQIFLSAKVCMEKKIRLKKQRDINT